MDVLKIGCMRLTMARNCLFFPLLLSLKSLKSNVMTIESTECSRTIKY